MKEQFDALGVNMVAISPNTVEQADSMRTEHGIGILQLADPDLKVIDLYGVRHAGALAVSDSGRGMERRAIAIPTTILVDSSGAVRWIDQSKDYRVRSNARRVLKAVISQLSKK